MIRHLSALGFFEEASSVFSVLYTAFFFSSVKALLSALICFAVHYVPEDIYLRSQKIAGEAREAWCSGRQALKANLIPRDSPSERSEHGPAIFRPTEETSTEDVLRPH